MNRGRASSCAVREERSRVRCVGELGDRSINSVAARSIRSRARAMIVPVSMAVAVGIGNLADAQTMSKAAHARALRNADLQYRADEATCGRQSGIVRFVCMEEAKGRVTVWKAQADAAFKNTPKAYENWRIATANADYRIASAKCNDVVGPPRETCLAQAKAAFARAIVEAKADRDAETRHDASAVTMAKATTAPCNGS